MANYRSSTLPAQARAAVLEAPSADTGYDNLRAILLSLRSRIGPSQIIPLCGALLFAVGCTLWAIQEGVSIPLALMGGYCTIVAGIILCVAQLTLTQVNASTAPAQAPRKPNYAAWKLVNKLNVSNASRLWCDIEPGHPCSQDSIAWSAAILDAIKSGALPISPKAHATAEMISRERANPGWNTEVTRQALKSWALAHGHSPAFLKD
ncbi:hypothetical protein [Pseudorhodoplanes sp.]|uniref:hypothetical protein n=1 Tax=Pseudorhodoplanes sp. TaxID=1934341 RepID=UPI003D099E14